MDLIGKTTIHPVLFSSGKISGYLTWIVLFLSMADLEIINCYTTAYNKLVSGLLLFPGLILAGVSLFNLGHSTRFGLPKEDTDFVVK